MAYKKKDKSTNNDLPNTTQKTKDRATRTPLKTWVNSRALKRDQSNETYFTARGQQSMMQMSGTICKNDNKIDVCCIIMHF